MSQNQLLALVVTVLAQLFYASAALAEDKITCIIAPVECQTGSPETTPAQAAIVTKGVTGIFDERLNKSDKFEVETRDESKLAPGATFKAARFVVCGELSVFPHGETERMLLFHAKAVHTVEGMMVAIVRGEGVVKDAIVWPAKLEDYSSDEFKKSDLGKALTAAIDSAVSGLEERSDKMTNYKEQALENAPVKRQK